ncbi:lipocalin-like domain-containing protein [Streptomyces sp. LZ34]
MNASTAALADGLVGAWTLASYVTADADGGHAEHPLGADAQGVIIYTADGFMSVQISSSGRPAYSDGALHGGTPPERAAAAVGYLAYAGTYSVADDVVTHQPTTSLFPNWEGADVPRRARITGDTLTLDLIEPILKNGRERTGTLTWRRAPHHPRA